MEFGPERRKRIADILEKLGLTILISAVGHIFVVRPSGWTLVFTLLGIALGIVFLIFSVIITKDGST